MTLQKLYRQAKQMINSSDEAWFDDHAFDILCLMKKYLNATYEDTIIKSDIEIPCEQQKLFMNAVKLRCTGYPLQYILGEWEFDDLKLKVGEGVLIPREDTLVLVNEISKRIDSGKKLRILDLCAGSGAISLSLAKRFPLASVTAVEISNIAMKYFNENIRLNNISNITLKKYDVLDYPPNDIGKFDIIVSNPPYIKECELSQLQKEVLYEPKLALNGGTDGLLFYENICNNWLCILKKHGIIGFEIGESQSENVSRMLKNNNIIEVKSIKDLNGLDRVILGNKG